MRSAPDRERAPNWPRLPYTPRSAGTRSELPVPSPPASRTRRTDLERQLTIRRANLDALFPDPANARQYGEANMGASTASLQRFGQAEPLVVHAGTGPVIGGNGRLAAIPLQATLDASLFDAAKGACHGAAA